jgi:4'-phosphopantetheinyl transferase EntD
MLLNAWRSLLPPTIKVVAGPIRSDVPPLTPLERSSAGSVGSARLRELMTGRHYAKRALSMFGLNDVQLPIGPDRSPVWPSAAVGSITHAQNSTKAHCAVAIGLATDFSSIGIDIELDIAVPPHVWTTFLTPRELRQINSLDETSREADILNRWCVKEAIAKADRALPDPIQIETKIDGKKSPWLDRCRTDYVGIVESCRWVVRTVRVAGFVLAAVAVPHRQRQ